MYGGIVMTTGRLWIAISALALFCTSIQAQDAAPGRPSPLKVTVNIDSMPIREALKAFGEQSGLQILFRSEDTSLNGVTAPRVAGELSVQEALDRMLVNTGLRYEFVNKRTVRISTARPVSSIGAPDAPSRLAQADVPARRDADNSTVPPGSVQASSEAAAPTQANIYELVVTAPRAKATARLQEFTAPNLINVQSAEQIAKFPDFDSAEAISRVPGVSLTGDTGEGRFVNIRGIDNNLNGTTFGGVVLLNTQPQGTLFGSGRGVELDTIPIGSIDRIIVTKTGLPDHEAEGLGGSIELTPRSAAAVKRPLFAELVLGGGYESLRPNFSPRRAELVVGGRLGGDGFSADGPLAFVVTASEFDDRRAIDDIEPLYAVDAASYPNTFPGANKVLDSINFRRYNYHRRRFGVGEDIVFQPNEKNSFHLRANVAGYIESVNNQQFHYMNLSNDPTSTPLSPTGDPAAGTAVFDPANPKGFLAPAAATQLSQRSEEEAHRNTVVALGGTSQIGAATLSYEAAYSRATFSKGHDFNPFFNGPSVSLSYDNNTDPAFPTFNILNGVNVHDPAQYNLAFVANLTDYSVDQEWSYRADIAFPVNLLSETDRLKFGAKVRLRNKIDTPITQVFGAGPPFGFAPTGPSLNLTSVLGDGPFTNFYGNRYNVGNNIDANAFARFFQQNQGAFVENAGDATLNAAAFFKAQENIYAGYGQYETTLGRFGFLTGVRVEATRATYAGNIVTIINPDPTVPPNITPTSTPHDYTNVFPTAQIRYEVTPDAIVRATYSTGIGRPGFTQIAPSTQIQVAVSPATVSTGNPNLRPITGNNFDLSFDANLPHAGTVQLGLFDKEFRNYVVGRSDFGDFPGVTGRAFITSFVNAPTAFARGLEAAISQPLWFLPSILDGLGVSANVTLVDSDVELRAGEHHLLPATARVTANAAVFYSKYGVDVQLSAQDVGQSLFTIGTSPDTDVFQARRITMDLTSTYALRSNMQLYFNAKNLLDTPLRFNEGNPDRPTQREFYGQTLEIGVRIQL
jgi:TonB-dependent receptor